YDQLLPKNDLFYLAISRNALNSLDLLKKNLDWKVTFSHLEVAVEYHSEEVFNYLLNEYSLSSVEKEQLANRARKLGNITILNQLNSSPLYYFEQVTKILEKPDEVKPNELEKNVFNLVSRAYRFTLSIREVDSLCDGFKSYLTTLSSTENSDYIKAIEKGLNDARECYLKWGSVIAPYRTPSHFSGLKQTYKSSPQNLEGDNIEKEIKFGTGNYKIVEDLLKQEAKLETGSLPFDDILNYVNQYNAENSKKLGLPEKDRFGVLRDSDDSACLTLLVNRYREVFPYIKAAYENIGQWSDAKSDDSGYTNKLSETAMSSISFDHFASDFIVACGHGYPDPLAILPDIRKLHDELCLMSSKEIQEKPSEFYKKVAQVLSLIGKMTPYHRGTGRLVETWLAYIHAKKDLPCPILSKVQLDCLNIALPSSMEEQLLLYFFKRDSLTKSAQEYLDKLSENVEIDKLLQKCKLGKYEIQTISKNGVKSTLLTDEQLLENFLNQEYINYRLSNKEGINILTWARKNNPNLINKILSSPEFKSENDFHQSIERIKNDFSNSEKNLNQLLEKLKKNFPDNIAPQSFLSLKPVTDVITIAFNTEQEAKKFAGICKIHGADSQGKTRNMYGKHPTDPKKFVAFVSLSKDIPMLVKKTESKDMTSCLTYFNGDVIANPAWELTFTDENSAKSFLQIYKDALASVTTVPGANKYAQKYINIEKTGIFTRVAKILLSPENLKTLYEFEVPKTTHKKESKNI
ncbi:MAG: hypothetical protein JO131_07705, partial [Gammaproteobacteria bacterium]|nr:hypothetical protein [Gammaproteobacteria bacterium]